MTTKQEKAKKNEYDKALAAYDLAMKSFHKKEYEKVKGELATFEKDYPKERELIDRVNTYLQICEDRLKPVKTPLKTPEDYFQNGIHLMNQRQFDEALKSLDKARAKKPKDAKILYAMADANCLKEDHAACLDLLKQAVELDPSLAVLARNEKDFEPLKEDESFLEITTMG